MAKLAAVCLLAGSILGGSAFAQITANVGSTVSTAVSLTITTAGTINSTPGTGIQVMTQGQTGLDFNYATGGTCVAGNAYTVNQTCTVKFTFSPSTPGLRMGAVELFTASGTAPIAVAYVYGIGNAPLAVFSPGTISTVAGTGSTGYVAAQDGGPATSAELYRPTDVAVDAAGNFYIADEINDRIRKVTAATGIITTVAGGGASPGTCSGSTNSIGDGCAATSASLHGAMGVAVDGAGNLYIADYNNSRIREVSAATGIITTVAGDGTFQYVSSQDGGPATSAALNHPNGVAVDGSGNFYIADYNNNRIRKVAVATGIITTVAGNGTYGYTASQDGGLAVNASLANPTGVTIDGAGDLYIADQANNRIREVSSLNNDISTVAGNGTYGYAGDGGTATSAELQHPYAVAVDAAGNLYISDQLSNHIRKVTAVTTVDVNTGIQTAQPSIITTVAGNGTGAYSGDNGPATSAEINETAGVSLDGAGDIYIADYLNNVIRKVTAEASPINFPTPTNVGYSDQTDYSSGIYTFTMTNDGNKTLLPAPDGGVLNMPQDFSRFDSGLVPNDDTCRNNVNTEVGVLTGNSCTYSLYFWPWIAGSINEPLVLINNNLNITDNTQSILLSGTGVAPTGITQPQTITFQPLPASLAPGVPVTPAATASSGLFVIFSIDSSSTATGYFSNTTSNGVAINTLTATSTGTLIVDANQGGGGSGNYAPAPQVQQTIVVTVSASYTAPTTAVGATSATQTAQVNITASGTLGAISVLTQGTPNLDYAFVSGGTCATGTAYTVGQSCTVMYSFTPSTPGMRMGAVVLSTSTPAVLGTTYISGTGTGPLVSYTPGTITTLAGNGTLGNTGDNGLATSAEVAPNSVAVDGAGNLYFASSNFIRKVTAATGDITTVAGNGSCAIVVVGTAICYSGDGGPATSAELSAPVGVAVDGAGNLYIADSYIGKIREVNAVTGIITSVAGGIDNSGYLGGNGDNAPAITAGLSRPTGVAVDGAGNFYIADSYNEAIRKVTAATGIITTVAGNGSALGSLGDNGPAISASLNAPTGVALDGAGNFYFADQNGALVRKVTVATGIINTVAGGATCPVVGGSANCYIGDGGPATSAALYQAEDVAVDAGGNVYIADRNNNVVRKVTAATGIISTVAGNGYGHLQSINGPNGGFSGDNGPATSAEMYSPTGVALDSAGNLYIADSTNYRIREVTAAGSAISFPTATKINSTDTTDGPYTLTLANTGNAALSFPVPTTGTDPSIASGFTIGGSSTCPQLTTSSSSAGSLASGATCTDLISFAPTVVGSNSGSLVTTDNNYNISYTTQSVALSGTAVAPPTVTSISPNKGATAGGTSVTITGTYFTGATGVTIGGTAATSVTVVNSTTITATTPAGTLGTASVVVTTPVGSNSANTLYTYVTLPTVTNINPSSGTSAGGTSVVIYGTGFTGATGVTIGGAAATSVTVVNSNTISAVTPAGALGAASVVVTTPNGSNAANTLYTYMAVPPTVTSINPTNGPASGGTNVTIHGTNFTGATSVTIGGTPVTSFNVVQSTAIAAVTAAGTAGAASVVVTTPGGSNVANTLYTYNSAAPTVASISPSSGPLTAGTSVTITGTGFTAATGVTIGGAAVGSYTVNSDTSITATAPAGTAGTASVLVTTALGTNSANTLYTYVAAPTVSAISPVSGPLTAGTSITITGTNLTGATSVTIGGAAATGVVVVNSTTISATAPAGSAGPASVLVTTAGGTNSANTLYTYVAAPTVSNISPSSGPLTAGTSVTITGTGFTGATAVTIGGAAATGVTVVSATSITATAPAGTAGTASVVVTTVGGSNSANTLYTYVAAPTVTGISPVSGPVAGGQTVTITGTNLSNATGVTIGGVAATNLTANTATSITVKTPAGSAGSASVLVTTVGGTNSSNTLYTYVAAPTVTSVIPSSGPLTGGTSLTITGTGFTGAISVTIGGVAATGFTVVNATTIAATAPAGTAGPASVLVTTIGGTNSANSLYTYAGVPTVTSVIPSSGSTLGSQSVTITGTNFTGATAVTIGGAAATSVTVVNATTITAKTPAGSAGPASVLVTTVGGTNSANTLYTYVAGPIATQSIANTVLTQNKAATPFTPVTGSGGAAPLSYSVLPTLPTGLTMSSTTGAITGTPTATSALTTYTVTVTDASSATATNTFALTVNAAVTASQSVATKTLTQNKAATAFTPVTGGSGTAPLVYSVSPSLPTGLTLSSTTGAITGTPTIVSSTTIYTVTVTDANSATATNNFSLIVSAAVTATQSVAATLLTQNYAATSFTPVTGANGTTPLSYSVAPTLPAGLTMASATGAITGTPTAVITATTYTVTVTDANSATASNTFSLTVNAAVTATQAVATTLLTQNYASASFTPVTGANGTTPLSYSVTPSLPAGLTMASATGAISGTATVASLATTYTTTVTDANGATASKTFSLTVNAAVSATTSVPTSVLPLNLLATPFTPVTATGGTGVLTYTITPTLPAGLTISSSTGAVSGTPTAISSATIYTVKATDTLGANNSATFSLQVGQAPQTIIAFAPATPLTYGASPVTLTATGGASGNAVTFSVLSGPGSVSGTNGATLTITGAGTIVVAANQAGNSSYLAATQATASIVVNKAPLTVTANPATIVYGQTLPVYTDMISGFVNGDSISVVSGAAALSTSPATPVNVGVYPITPAIGSLTAANYSFSTFTPANLTINMAGVTVTLISNHASGNAATNFTYTATVSSTTTGLPTGTVTITATPTSGGPFTYGPLTMAGGVASGGGRMTGAGNGPVTVTASYSGDPNFAANIGTTIVTLGTANYTLSASPSSLTITRGTPAITTVTMTPLSGYVGTATFSCGSLPAYASCVFTPTSLTTTDGVTPQTAVMTIYTLAPAAVHAPSASMLWIPGALLALLIFVGRKRMKRPMQSLLMLVLLATLAMGATGCGGAANFVTPTGADTISINVTAIGAPGSGSSDLNQSLNLNVTIQ